MTKFKKYNYWLLLFFTTQVVSILPDAVSEAIPKMFGLAMPDLFKNIELLAIDKRLVSNKELQSQAIQKTEAFFELIKKDSLKIKHDVLLTIKKLETELSENEVYNIENFDKNFFYKKKQLLENRIKLNNEILETLKLIESSIEVNDVYTKTSDEISFEDKSSYSMDDVFKIEDELVAILEKIKLSKAKKEKNLKLINVSQEKSIIEKKELENQINKKNKLLAASSADNKTAEQKYESLNLKIDLSIESQKLLDLKLRRQTLESINLDDEILLLNKKKAQAEANLNLAKDRLFISNKDLLLAREQFKEYSAITIANKTKNKKILDEKNKEKIQLEELIERAEANLKTLSLKDFNKKILFLEQSKADLDLIKQKHKVRDLEHEIGLLELNGDLDELKILEQNFKLRNIEIHLGVKQSHFNVEKYLELMRDEKKQIDSRIKNYDATNYLAPNTDDIALTKTQIKLKIIELTNRNDNPKLQSSDLEAIKIELEKELESLSSPEANQFMVRYTGMLFEIIYKYKQLKIKYSNLIKEIAEKFGKREIWSRSPRAISLENLMQSMHDAEEFFVNFFWVSQTKLSPWYFIALIKTISMAWLLAIVLLLFCILILYVLLSRLFELLRSRLGHRLMLKSGQTGSLPWTFLSGLFEFLDKNFFAIFLWLCLDALIKFQPINLFGLTSFNIDPYFVAVFYLISIPIFINFSKKLLECFHLINQKMSYFFFNEKSQQKNRVLTTIWFYSGSVILPLRSAFLYFGTIDSKFPAVLFAAYTLILSIVFLLFFDKEDLLSILPERGRISSWIKQQVSHYYYPGFLFFMTILIIYNPYIGYFNLAWKLLMLVPLSIFLIWFMLQIHEYLRKNLIQVFIIEDDDGAVDRFEHAKLLYSFFVFSIFFLMTVLSVFLVARIWGFSYTLQQLWQALTTEWVLKLPDGDILGLVQVIQFAIVIFIGFLSSSLVNNFVLARLFDAFDTEPGLQNTISRILHYCMICIFFIIGLLIIGFTKFVFPMITLLFIGIVFSLKDQVSDIAAGIFILLERQFEIGHFVEISSEKIRGTVTKISFRSTVIKTSSNFFIAVPNRIMISKPVINWGMGKFAIAIEVEVEVDYAASPELVREVIFSVLNKHEMILKSPTPVVRLERFQPSGAVFLTKAFFSGRRVREIWNLASDIRLGILQGFKDNGIKIPYPHRVVNLLSGERPIYNAPDQSGVNIKILNQDENANNDKNNKG